MKKDQISIFWLCVLGLLSIGVSEQYVLNRQEGKTSKINHLNNRLLLSFLKCVMTFVSIGNFTMLFLVGHGVFDDQTYNDPIGEFTGKITSLNILHSKTLA